MALAFSNETTSGSPTVFAGVMSKDLPRILTNSILMVVRFWSYFFTLKAWAQPIFGFKWVTRNESTFANLVTHVVQRSTKKKMFYVYARWVIARVTHKHSDRYFSFIYNPDVPVSTYSFPFIPFS